MTEPFETSTFLANAGTVERPVADDMSAIFGSAPRMVGDTPSVGKPEDSRSVMRRPVFLTACVGILAMTVAAGVYAGNDVTAAPVAASAFQVATRPLRSLDRHPTSSLPVTAAGSGGAASLPLPPSALAASPDSTLRQAPAGVVSSAADARRVRPYEPISTAFPYRSVPAAVAPPALKTSLSTSCDEDSDECDAHRIDAAEQRIADAYARAVDAGARLRDLRGYRGEWNRARGEATEQPRHALHLYAMITSDLLTLAEDADPGNDGSER